jgi:hypothetical protein
MAIFEDVDAGYGLMTNMESAPVDAVRTALRRAAVNQPLPPVPGPSLAMKMHQLYSTEGTQPVIDLFAEHVAQGDREMLFAVYQFSKDLLLNSQVSDAEAMAKGMTADFDHPLLEAFLEDVTREVGGEGL